MSLSRNVPIEPARAALLYIDVQNYCAHRDGGEFSGLGDTEFDSKYGWFFSQLSDHVIPNMKDLQTAFRDHGI